MKYVLILMFLLTGCDAPSIPQSYPSSMESLVDEVRNQTFVQLKMEKELHPCGIGSGMKDKIRMLALSFNYYRELNIEEARELLMYATRVFLDKINSNQEIRPFLLNDPFTPFDIDITVFLRNLDGSYPNTEKLQVIAMTNGRFIYKIDTPARKQYKTILTETFAEAEKNLKTPVIL